MKQKEKSHGKSAAASTHVKVQRDLREEFDEYVLKEEDEAGLNPHDESIQKEHQHDSNQQEEQVFHIKHSNNERSSVRQKQSQSNLRKSSKQNIWRPEQTQTYSNNKLQLLSVPRSYLLAMEHLQDLVQSKDETINMLKEQLMQKQSTILDCQSRINEMLVKYNQLMSDYNFKQNQIEVLKRQMQELRTDKHLALKRAAKIIQPEFRPYPGTNLAQESMTASSFRERSRSTGLFAPHLYRDPLATVSESKEIESTPVMQNFNGSKSRNSSTGGGQYKVSDHLITKLFTDKLGPSLNSVQKLPSSSLNPLSSGKQNRDFISYQRQILRNEKELIALKYRMECLERKLSTNAHQEGVKTKIRKLSQQIECKQKTINELKKV